MTDGQAEVTGGHKTLMTLISNQELLLTIERKSWIKKIFFKSLLHRLKIFLFKAVY